MTPERWAQVKEVLGAALEKPDAERSAFLDQACGTETWLRQEIERLLAADDPRSFESPVAAFHDSEELACGKVLGHYRVESKLGRGGMGTVYKAWDERLERPVALKMLSARHFDDAAHWQRFLREARAASALNHPNIVTVHEVGCEAGVDFIAMEYIEGQTLDRLIPAKGLPLDRALDYAVAIAGALAHAHAAGIVHRDLKPGNIMVTGDGLVKLLDFGLARRVRLPDRAATTLTLSCAGEILGTPAYMSPEQAEGKKTDERSDIFSFGVVLYEMVSGRQAFTGDSLAAILGAVLKEEPSPLRGIPAGLEQLVRRCVEKDPARRIRDMHELKVALAQVKSAGTAASKTVWAGGPWFWAILMAVLLVGFLGSRILWSPPAREPLQPAALVTSTGFKSSPCFSPDGNHVVFTWSGPKQDNLDIYVQQIGAGSPFRLTTDPRADYEPAWSPDSRWIAFLRGGLSRSLSYGYIQAATASPTQTSELRLIPPLGGPERMLAEVRLGAVFAHQRFLAWCPDSDCVIVADSQGQGKPCSSFHSRPAKRDS